MPKFTYDAAKLGFAFIAGAAAVKLAQSERVRSYLPGYRATQGKTVYVDMVADLFHPGHQAVIKNAFNIAGPGGRVIVGLMSDADVESYKRRPIYTVQERARFVEASEYVHKVVQNAPLRVTKDFIEENQIDLVLHGDDMSQEQLNYYYAQAMELGKFRTFPYTPGISTTDVIRRITERADEFKPMLVNKPKI